VDLQRDVLDQAAFPLLVSDSLRLMDARIYRAEPMGTLLQAGALL
jgi:acyl CoA:acetate/3-ketoacid CoA transferase